jgi:hypothetical protein
MTGQSVPAPTSSVTASRSSLFQVVGTMVICWCTNRLTTAAPGMLPTAPGMLPTAPGMLPTAPGMLPTAR